MTTVAVIGADGQLGSELVSALERDPRFNVEPLTLDDINICDFAGTRSVLSMNRPAIVINTAAFSRVDDCEDQPEEAFRVNAAAVHNLARICRDLDTVLMHFSTDFVMGGDASRTTPFVEEDRPNPESVYATSKLAGEYVLRNTWPKHYLIRTCGLYGAAARQGGRASNNFIEVMLHLAQKKGFVRVVNDQRVAPTSTRDLALTLVELLGTDRFGLYHVTNAGACTWHEFAAEVFRLAGLSPRITGVSSAEWGAKARRPAYSILDNAALRRAGLAPLRSWQEALAAYLGERAASPKEEQ
jgi:dTDP-4-dehydrorhamnose reductase